MARWGQDPADESRATEPDRGRGSSPGMTPVPLRAPPIPTDAPRVTAGVCFIPAREIGSQMHGMIQALGRLLVMGLVMTAVLVAAVFAGVGPTTAIALGIVLAGVVGLVGVARRPAKGAPVQQIAAMQATIDA